MTQANITNPFADMFKGLNFEMPAFNDVFKSTALLSEKFSKVALTAAEKNAEISNKWTKDALKKLSTLSKAQGELSDFSKASTDFASASAETASEHVAAFSEVAKKVQLDTVELLLAASKDAQFEATSAAKKVATETVDAVKKVVNNTVK